MNKQTQALWAKKEETAGRFYWLPLTVHLQDTMNVSRWLWNNWISDGQREFCINSISTQDEETASNTAAFLGAIHDIGKATPAFQVKRTYGSSSDLDEMLLEKLERAGFFGISQLELTNPEKSHHSIAGEYLLKEEFHVKDDIGSIIGGHHGKPVDESLKIDNQSSYTANYYQTEDSTSDIYGRWRNVQRDIFQWSLEESGFDSIDGLPEISKPAQVLFSGLLIMADWISSNRDYFPLVDLQTEYVPDAKARYQNGITAWSENVPLQLQNYPSISDLFIHRFGFEPREFQKTVYQTVNHIENPGIIILEAPMGLGKTEAALAAAEEVAVKTGRSGLFFGLPTQATSNGMFSRVHQWLESVTKEYHVKQSLRLCHGKAALNEEMSSIRNSAHNINVDEESDGSVFVNEWFSGRKRTSLDDFVVGTVDGFLLTALKQKHLALRHLGFSKKVVIIDEVHAYDTYMQQYLEEAVQWMGAYRTPVILVSATLPQGKRKDLISAYLRGRGIKERDMEFPEELVSGDFYPLISYTEGNKIKIQSNFSKTDDKVVSIRTIADDELLAKLTELIDGGGVIGIIVNTVKRAQKIGKECKELFGADTVDILHSAFIATDRVNRESNLIKMIGKNGTRPEKKIIVGTQVIEQSLDIDFDVLITDLCPIDLLLQRIGRLHRHEIKRPDKHRQPEVYVMGINRQFAFETGSERIYGKYYLIRTQFYLPEQIRIPSDIPILIHKVYGQETPELPEELEKVFLDSREKMEYLQKDKADKALTYRIGNPSSRINPERYNLIGWLREPDCSYSDEAATAQVRDIMETIEVIAVKKVGKGYGTFNSGEDISGKIDVPEIAKELAKQTIRIPTFVTAKEGVFQTIEFLEKYNLKYLPEWQNQPWLKGTLGIIFNEEGYFEINNILLKYDSEFGLREEKEYGKI